MKRVNGFLVGVFVPQLLVIRVQVASSKAPGVSKGLSCKILATLLEVAPGTLYM